MNTAQVLAELEMAASREPTANHVMPYHTLECAIETITRLDSDNAKLQARVSELEKLCGRAYCGIVDHHSYDIMNPKHQTCPYCSSNKGNALINDLFAAKEAK